MADINFDFELFQELGDDLIFEVFGVLVYKSVVFMHHYGCGLFVPNVEHCGVDDEGFGGLGVVGDCLADYIGIVTAAEEPALTASDADDVPNGEDLGFDPTVPLVVSRECGEVFGLEGGN